MAKANQAVKAETPTHGPPADGQSNAQNDSPSEPDPPLKPLWPVESAAELTVAHVPPKLRDEILRPYRAAARTLWQQLAEQVDSRNDIQAQLAQLVKAAQKDADRLNRVGDSAGLRQALIALGVGPKEGQG